MFVPRNFNIFMLDRHWLSLLGWTTSLVAVMKAVISRTKEGEAKGPERWTIR